MRQKVSPATRKLRGNTSGKQMRPAFAGAGDLWDAPRWFNKALRDKWNYMLETAPKGLLTGTDKDLLVAWCVACVGHNEAARALIKEGATIAYDNGTVVQNPNVFIMTKHASQMLHLSKVLGFNPASRAALGSMGAGYGDMPLQIEGSVESFIEERPASLAA